MRVLHIIPSLEFGGAERLAFDISNELSIRNDIEIKLITFQGLNDFGERYFINHIPTSIKLSIYDKNQFDVSKLQNEIESFAPHIIHSHLFLAEIVSRSCLYPKAKWFSHFHDNMPQLAKFKLKDLNSKSSITNYYEKQYLFNRYCKNGGNRFIAISQDASQYASSVLPTNAKIYYLKNAINYEAFFSPIKRLDRNLPVQLINVGSFQKKKNQQFLVDVLKLLVERNVNCTLVCLGDGAEIKIVKDKVAKYGLENRVSFKGNVGDVKQQLDQSNIYVHSAYYEPFGLVLLEAMAAGLPVVCLNGGGNADIIEDGTNGFMLEDAIPTRYAQRIEELVSNQELYNAIATKGQQTAKQYGIKKYCDQLVELYEESRLDFK